MTRGIGRTTNVTPLDKISGGNRFSFLLGERRLGERRRLFNRGRIRCAADPFRVTSHTGDSDTGSAASPFGFLHTAGRDKLGPFIGWGVARRIFPFRDTKRHGDNAAHPDV